MCDFIEIILKSELFGLLLLLSCYAAVLLLQVAACDFHVWVDGHEVTKDSAFGDVDVEQWVFHLLSLL